jgi:hypothetical protein
MNIENAAQELLAHGGVYAVAISPDTDRTYAVADDSHPETARNKMTSLCSNSISLHRRVGISGMSRLVLNEEPFGSVSVVTNTFDGMMVAVLVQAGHSVCKSLQRMIKRAVARAKKGTKLRSSASSPIPEAVV